MQKLNTLGHSFHLVSPSHLWMSRTALSVGELTDLEWKFGVALSSNYQDQVGAVWCCPSHASQLNSPFVSLKIVVKDNQGHPSSHCIEMNLGEFQAHPSTLFHSNPFYALFDSNAGLLRKIQGFGSRLGCVTSSLGNRNKYICILSITDLSCSTTP